VRPRAVRSAGSTSAQGREARVTADTLVAPLEQVSNDRSLASSAIDRALPLEACTGQLPLVTAFHAHRHSASMKRSFAPLGATAPGPAARSDARILRLRGAVRHPSASATFTTGRSIVRVKVLALYDIHGNVEALEAVLADSRAAAPDAVVVGGDAVPGPSARAVLDRLDTLTLPFYYIRGNGERETAEAAAATAPPADDDLAGVTAAVTAAELGTERARALGDLPLVVTLDGVLYCHATPRADNEMVTRASTPERYADVLGGVDVGVVIAGHTHQQDDRRVGAVRFINAGSVGLPYEGDAAARWVWVIDGSPELRSTTYDAEAAGIRMLAAGWPDERSVRGALVDPVTPNVVTELFEQLAHD
jgi:predicted phosphodiesterase